MYKLLAAFNGMLIAFMVLSNGIMVEYFGNTPAVLANHFIGLIVIASILVVTKEKWISLKGIPLFYLLGGVTGIATVYYTNLSFLALGATITLMLSMVGRIVTSTVIDHFGLMGMAKHPFYPQKIIGLFLMLIGLVLIIIS